MSLPPRGPQPPQPFKDQLKTPLLPRSLPWSPPETITSSSTANPNLPLSATLSLRTQGLGLCPLRDPVLSQPMTQIHSTAGLGQRGSGWQFWRRPELEECVWDMGANMYAFWRQSTHHPELANLTEARVLEGLLDLTVQPPVVQRGKPRPRPRKEGTCPESSNWLVAEPPARGAGTLGFQSQLCSISASYSTFIETEDKELGVCENSNTSRTQGLATVWSSSTFHILCPETQPKGWGRWVSPHHWGRLDLHQRYISVPRFCLSPPHCANSCDSASIHSM